MDLKNTNDALNLWAKEIVREAKRNAIKEFGNQSSLPDRLDYDVKTFKNSVKISFFPGYASFVDLGVRGNTGNLDNEKRPTPYKYRDKMPPTYALDKWVLKKFKGQTRNDKGQFVKRSSLKFAIAKSIQQHGIKQTLFFTKPFEKYFKKLPQAITERFGEDVLNYYKTAFKDSIKDQFEISAAKAQKFTK